MHIVDLSSLSVYLLFINNLSLVIVKLASFLSTFNVKTLHVATLFESIVFTTKFAKVAKKLHRLQNCLKKDLQMLKVYYTDIKWFTCVKSG